MFLLLYSVGVCMCEFPRERECAQERCELHMRVYQNWRMIPNISRLSPLILNDHCIWFCALFKERKRNWFNSLSHYTTQEEFGKRKCSGILSGKKNIVTAPWRNLCAETTGRNYGDELRSQENAQLPWKKFDHYITELYVIELCYRRPFLSFTQGEQEKRNSNCSFSFSHSLKIIYSIIISPIISPRGF